MKLSLKNMTVIAMLGGFAAAGAAFADSHSGDNDGAEKRMPRAERMFQKMDTDGDGKVSAEDAKAFATERFSKRDIDGDGVVSREDRQTYRAAQRDERRTKRFEKIDADGDGMISLEEFKQAKSERGNRGMRGKRGDGERMEHGERRERGEGPGKRGDREARGERGQHGKGMRRVVLTIQEAEARAMQRFERIDADNDGVITIEDVKAFKPRRGHRK